MFHNKGPKAEPCAISHVTINFVSSPMCNFLFVKWLQSTLVKYSGIFFLMSSSIMPFCYLFCYDIFLDFLFSNRFSFHIIGNSLFLISLFITLRQYSECSLTIIFTVFARMLSTPGDFPVFNLLAVSSRSFF